MTRKEQKEERRKAILMTALTIFVERGYYETKITDIASAVPMSTGLLFHYFESKEDLLKELVIMGVEGTKFTEKLPPMAPEVFFEQFLKMLFDFSSSEPWVFQMFILMGQARRPGMPEEARKIALTVNTPKKTALIIKQGQESGVFREGNPYQMSVTFWAAVQGIIEEMAVDKNFHAPDPKWIVAMLRK